MIDKKLISVAKAHGPKNTDVDIPYGKTGRYL